MERQNGIDATKDKIDDSGTIVDLHLAQSSGDDSSAQPFGASSIGDQLSTNARSSIGHQLSSTNTQGIPIPHANNLHHIPFLLGNGLPIVRPTHQQHVFSYDPSAYQVPTHSKAVLEGHHTTNPVLALQLQNASSNAFLANGNFRPLWQPTVGTAGNQVSPANQGHHARAPRPLPDFRVRLGYTSLQQQSVLFNSLLQTERSSGASAPVVESSSFPCTQQGDDDIKRPSGYTPSRRTNRQTLQGNNQELFKRKRGDAPEVAVSRHDGLRKKSCTGHHKLFPPQQAQQNDEQEQSETRSHEIEPIEYLLEGCFPLCNDQIDRTLSKYQAAVRQQLEVFIVDKKRVNWIVRGRRKPISVGQVGIRCKHCKRLPHYRQQKGASYFPTAIQGVYQAAQNIARSHLLESCGSIDPQMRRNLKLLSDEGDTTAPGGKERWIKACKELGIYEAPNCQGLRIRKSKQKLCYDG